MGNFILGETKIKPEVKIACDCFKLEDFLNWIRVEYKDFDSYEY